jgi:iron complex transport system ATP-binding protein
LAHLSSFTFYAVAVANESNDSRLGHRMIRATGLSVTMSGRQILHDINIQVKPGEWLALLGPNGSGKTTLLRALLGFQQFTGSVSMMGATIAGGPADELVNIAYVPQRPELPAGMSVTEYVALGRARTDGWGRESLSGRQVCERTMERLHLTELAERFVTELSGGEAQRAVLARALVQEPDVLLLDEPTSALDPQHRLLVLDLIRETAAGGVTVVAAMHDITLAAMYADRAAVLDSGRLTLAGQAHSVVADPAFAQVFGGSIRVVVIDGLPVLLPLPMPAASDIQGIAPVNS